MSQARRYPPAQVELEFGNGFYLFRLPLRLVAALQEARGARVTWPDGAVGRKPKPLGQIWREHVATGEYDPLDSVEIIRLGLIGGGLGRTYTGEEVKVTELVARGMVEDILEPMPREELWGIATAILVAVCQGFVSDEEPKPGEGEAGQMTEAGEQSAAPGTEDSSTSPPQ